MAQTVLDFKIATEGDSSADIPHDRRKLSAGAAQIRYRFDPEQRKKIANAKALNYSNAMLAMSEQKPEEAMQDFNLAMTIAGLEASDASEVEITNFLNSIRASFPQLEMRWLKDLRKAVRYIKNAAARARERGADKNIVNEDDFLQQCGYGAKKLEDENAFAPKMFMRGNTKVALWTDPTTNVTSVVTLNLQSFTAKLNLWAPYRKSFPMGDEIGYQGVPAPPAVASLLFEHELDLPTFVELASSPVFTEDGELISDEGLHRESGIFLANSGDLSLPKVPSTITSEDLKKAISILVVELLGDFELDGIGRDDLVKAALGGQADNPPPASLLNTIGLILEQFARALIQGPVMPHLITKTAKGAGGGLLSNCIQVIVDGQPSSRPMPRSEEERRKAITTALKNGARFFCWDNVAGDVSSPALASATTEPVWTDRLLGQSAEISIPVRCSFMLVGIRPLLSDELRRRTSLIEMKPQTAKPEHRSGFRHNDLMQYVKQHRGDFVWAALVLIKNWLQKGRPAPKHAPVIGSYQAYRNVIGGIIEAAAPNWITWQSNRDALDEIASDGENDEIENLLSVWWEHGISTNGDEASALCTLAETHKVTLPVKRVQMGGEHEYSSRSLGKYLKSFVGRHFVMDDGTEVELSQSSTRGNGGYPWLLKKVDKAVNETLNRTTTRRGRRSMVG
jgi:hypothetical protein